MENGLEMNPWSGKDHIGSLTPADLNNGSASRDAFELAKVGKREVLKRRFGLTSMVGFACNLMLTWEAVIMSFSLGLENGGPAGLIYGFIGVWVGMLSVFAAMGELASMIPSAGGQYHWTSILAPQSSKRFLSYVTGWVCIIAWTAGPTAAIYLAGSVVQGLVALNIPSYDPKGWQVTLIMWAILLLCMIINTWLGFVLPAIEVLILILHVLGFFAVLIPLVSLGPRGNAHYIFTTFYNFGGWHDRTLATFIGLKGVVGAFLGTDGAVHMAEEVEDSSIVVPRSMLFAIVLNGAMGFAMLIAFLLFAGDLEAVLQAGSNFPFMGILADSMQSKSAAIVLSSMVSLLQGCVGIAAISSGSRMLWSFSRDQATPGWQWLRQVNRRTSIPNHTTYVIVIAAGLLSLINIGSSVVLSIILSLVLEAFFASYIISLSLLLYRRLRGDISYPSANDPPSIANETAQGRRFIWGPFRLRGWFGTANNIVAIIFSIIMMFFSCWPPKVDPAPDQVNYSIVMFSGITILSMGYYFGWARKHYQGPIIEVTVTG